MSCGNPHETPCNDIAQVLYLYIDGEIDTVYELVHSPEFVNRDAVSDGADTINLEIDGFLIQGITHVPSRAAIEIHFEECPPCNEVLDRETAAIQEMKGLLGRSCREEAPADLQALIAAQTQALAAQMASTTVQYSRTEITTTIIDENGAQTTIEIQSSTEIRGDFPNF